MTEQKQSEAAPTQRVNIINSVCLYWHQFSPHLEWGVNSQASPGQDASAEAQRFILSITRMFVWRRMLKCPELPPAHMHRETLQSGKEKGLIPSTHSTTGGAGRLSLRTGTAALQQKLAAFSHQLQNWHRRWELHSSPGQSRTSGEKSSEHLHFTAWHTW